MDVSNKFDKLRCLDLFSGMGGISLALSTYAETVAFCEVDKHAQAILLSRMETYELDKAPIWDDIKTLNADALEKEGIIWRGKNGRYEGIDLIAGGSPCQDLSVAGAGKGLGGERSGLFFEIIRLVREIGPEFVFFENVPAIRRRGLDRVLEEFAKAGYDSRYGFLSAFDVGAPHKRERFFLLAKKSTSPTPHADEFGLQGDLPIEPPSPMRRRSSHAGPEDGDGAMAGEHRSPVEGRDFRDAVEIQQGEWTTQPGIRRMAHGVPLRVDRIKRIGNSVVPQCVREAFERLAGIKK